MKKEQHSKLEKVYLQEISNREPIIYGELSKELSNIPTKLEIPKEMADYIECSPLTVLEDSYPDGMKLFGRLYDIYLFTMRKTSRSKWLPYHMRNAHLILYIDKAIRNYKNNGSRVQLEVLLSAFVIDIGYIYDLFVNGLVRNKKIVYRILMYFSNDNYIDAINIEDILYNIRLYFFHLYPDPDDFEQYLYETTTRMITSYIDSGKKPTKLVSYMLDFLPLTVVRDMYKSRGKNVYTLKMREPITTSCDLESFEDGRTFDQYDTSSYTSFDIYLRRFMKYGRR